MKKSLANLYTSLYMYSMSTYNSVSCTQACCISYFAIVFVLVVVAAVVVVSVIAHNVLLLLCLVLQVRVGANFSS